ncbi:hypothetical protein [Tellurirhabdus rosea]|uniref:hypothetical protein n=1 Tax=Tellurirhabdus rosea TaxID=2674997 RepID=UPI00224CB4B5|nr:hypothetical protein [Tellurirhabdus rosea]
MIDGFLAGRKIQIPESWAELPAGKVPEVLQLLYVLPESGQTYHELLRICLGMGRRQWKALIGPFFAADLSDEEKQENALVLHNVMTMVSWLWTQPVTVRPFPHFDHDDVRYLLPEEQMKTMSFGELSDAHIHFTAHVKGMAEGDEQLDLLVATICRPQRPGDCESDPAWDGDHREPYNPALTEYRAKKLASLPIDIKTGILVYFAGMEKDVLDHYDIFESASPDSAGEEEYPGQGWIKNQHLIAATGIFGNMRDTKGTSVHDILLYLEEDKKDRAARAKAEAAINR